MTQRVPGAGSGTELPTSLGAVLARVERWDVPDVAVAVVRAGASCTHGPTDLRFAVASITKLLTAWAVLVAVEERAVSLDDPLGPPGSTLAHLLCHAGGWSFEGDAVLAPPGTRRIYSNRGYEELADHVERSTGIGFGDYLGEAVLAPLGMASTELRQGAAMGAWSSLSDLLAFCAELALPTLLAAPTVELFRSVRFPELVGVVPGWGRFDPCPWGLGPELKGHKEPHWMGSSATPACLGHFGGSGTFLWLEPDSGLGCVLLGDRPFGDWAVAVWPGFSDLVRLTAFGVTT